MRLREFSGAALCAVLLLSGLTASAKDHYFDLAIRDLVVTDGTLPTVNDDNNAGWRTWDRMRPRAAVDGEGEAYVSGNLSYWNWVSDLREVGRLHVRAPAGKDVTGRLLLPQAGDEGMQVVKFRIPADKADKVVRTAFLNAKAEYLSTMLSAGVPGAAWFRHQRRLVRWKLRPTSEGEELGLGGQPVVRTGMDSGELSETYALFTGGRALSENLQLDRLLNPTPQGERTVDISTLEGITVKEIDWAPIIEGMNPKKDALAKVIPADQYALFFPSFEAMTQLTDEADTFGTPALAWMEPRSEDAGTKDKYQKQICLEMSAIARLLGPRVVASAAFTGSDPFLRMGSDVAVVFEAKNPTLLEGHVTMKQEAALKVDSSVERQKGEVGGLAYTGVCNPQRTVCSYLARRENVVLVTNSLAQVERIGRTISGELKAMESLPEYTFFRDRYKLEEEKESALLILSDITIRKWCSPLWRIADSRRLRAAAVLAELQAMNLDSLSKAEFDTKVATYKDIWPDVGEVTLTPAGVVSKRYGTLTFLKPVAEFDIEKVTPAEADAYRWFRDRYQMDWSQFFDPIAIRFYVDSNEVAVDISVMPLIAQSEYRDIIELTQGARIMPHDGDPHEDILFRYGMALNADSKPVREVSNFAVSFAPGLSGNALGWLGQYIVFYGDKDMFWEELAEAKDVEDYFKENYYRLPVALYVDVSSPMKVTAFLASLRAFIEQTAPGMTMWEAKKHKDQSYVKVSPAPMSELRREVPEKLALFYAVTGKKLVITLSERMLKNALNRQAIHRTSERRAKRLQDKAMPWLGESFNLQADGGLLEIIEKVGRKEYDQQMRMVAWGNLPILNEWRRLFPERDPADFHQQIWGIRLVCPGGGEYVWNDEWQTMESTVYGHPGQPKVGPGLLRPPVSQLTAGNFGVTFENDGLRARMQLMRSKRHSRSFVRNVFELICAKAPSLICASVPVLEKLGRKVAYAYEESTLL